MITYGGFLGLGDKYFLVPWSALNISQDREHVVLNVDEKKLENAPGFDKDNWPNLYDPNYALVIYRFYEVPFHGAMNAGGKSKSGQAAGAKTDDPIKGKISEALKHAKEAEDAANQGRADALVKHAEMALDKAKDAQKARPQRASQ